MPEDEPAGLINSVRVCIKISQFCCGVLTVRLNHHYMWHDAGYGLGVLWIKNRTIEVKNCPHFEVCPAYIHQSFTI